MGYEVRDNEAERRFEIALDGKLAFSRYHLSGDSITFLHTEVPKEFEGKGIGSALAKHVLEHAKANNLKVTPMCPFIKAYIDRHPEYQGLLKQG
jgi:predicted GNAT family acetyltransferase